MPQTIPIPKLSSSITEVVATVEPSGKTGSIYVLAIAPTNDPVQQLLRYPALVPVITGENLMVVTDQQLSGTTVAIKNPATQQAALLEPKALQSMPYSRAFSESIFMTVPWLGMPICFFMLFAVHSSTIDKDTSKPLSFSFTPLFFFICSIISCYPLVLVAMDLSHLIVAVIPLAYCLFVAFNLYATRERNLRVLQYKHAILTALRS